MKELLILLLLVGALIGIGSKDNLPINSGKYDLELQRNHTEYEPVKNDILLNALSSIGKNIIGDNSEIERPNGHVIEVGEKPNCESSIKFMDMDDLKFEEFPYDIYTLKYSSIITLGNCNQEFRIAFNRGFGYVKTFYFDKNFNGIIEKEEEFDTLEDYLRKTYKDISGNGITKKELQYSEYVSRKDDIPVTVKYIKGNGNIISEQIFLSFCFTRKQSATNADEVETHMTYEVKNYFSGICSVYRKKQNKDLKFILVDKNNNGVFNDFDQDSIFIDLNEDGNKEEYKLKQYYKSQSSVPLRAELFAFPRCLVVTSSSNPPTNSEELEPIEDK